MNILIALHGMICQEFSGSRTKRICFIFNFSISVKIIKIMERTFSTSRTDAWWVDLVASASVFSLAILYSIFRAVEGNFFEWGSYLSPIYPLPLKSAWISPAFFTLWVPAGFRITCYFCRRVYYRSIFADPPACMVREPKRNYKGESAFPYILLNLHRYFLFLAIIFVPIHWIHALRSFFWEQGFTVGLGSIILFADSLFLTLYVSSCHSLRHFLGGRVDVYSQNPVIYHFWKFVSSLNRNHGFFFWASLISVVVADLYIRLLSAGVINEIRIF